MPKLRKPDACPHCGARYYTVFYTPTGIRCQKCYRSEFVR